MSFTASFVFSATFFVGCLICRPLASTSSFLDVRSVLASASLSFRMFVGAYAAVPPGLVGLQLALGGPRGLLCLSEGGLRLVRWALSSSNFPCNVSESRSTSDPSGTAFCSMSDVRASFLLVHALVRRTRSLAGS